MNEVETPPKSFPLRRRLLWVGGAAALALLIVSLGVYGSRESRWSNDLAAVLAKLDDTDPGWRLESLEAARPEFKEKDDSAKLCSELAHMLGPNWPDFKLDERLRPGPIGELPDAGQKVVLEDEMKRLEGVRSAARRMVALPKGRFKIEYAPNPLSTRFDHHADVRKAAKLFDFESRYRAGVGEVSEAVRAGRGAVCAARSLYDEPTLLGQLTRLSVVVAALSGVERALALGESADGELGALQRLLGDEETHNTLLVVRRADRAMWYRLYSGIGSGLIPPEDDPLAPAGGEKESWLAGFLGKARLVYGRLLPQVMKELNRAVEIARLPSAEQASAEAALAAEAEDPDAPHLALVKKLGDGCRRKTASVAAMRGLIAVERYRMKYKKWPVKFGDVVPEFLKEVPTDPFDGKPLKMVRTAYGVIVYSVGVDGVDDGGRLPQDHPAEENQDIGYRLWDTANRRRPASPPKVEEKQP